MAPRPTTYATVDSMLRERAAHLRIDEDHRRAYQFGMCVQMLAQANSEIARLERKVNELEAEDRAEHDHECSCEACSWDRAADTAREMR